MNYTKGIWIAVNYGHCWAVECKLPDGQEHTIFTNQFCHATKFSGDPEDNANIVCNAVNNTVGKSINPESVPDLLEALKEAKRVIRIWNGMGARDVEQERQMWVAYESGSPEMKKINSAIEKAKI